MQPLDYQNQDLDPERRSRSSGAICALSACGVGLFANIAVTVATWMALGNLPRGTLIRPMGLAAFCMEIAAIAALLGLPIALIGIVQARRRRSTWVIGIAGVLMCLMPIITTGLFAGWITTRNGLIWEG